MKYCSNSNLQRNSFKIAAAFALTSHKTSSMIKTRQLNTTTEAELHTLTIEKNTKFKVLHMQTQLEKSKG